MESIDLGTIYQVIGKLQMEKELLLVQINQLQNQINGLAKELNELKMSKEDKGGRQDTMD